MDEAMRLAVKRGDEELIPSSRSDKDLEGEMNARSHKAGLTNRQGECVKSVRIMSRGFGESKLNMWARNENGELID